MSDYESMYLDTFRKILSEGKWVSNERTGTRCLTIPRHVYEIELKPNTCPLTTVKPSYPLSAISEITGYNRRYDNAQDFANINCTTWFVNANKTQGWLDNPARKGENDLGTVYGAAVSAEYIADVWENIQNNNDHRGLILDWWQVDKFKTACLRACMYSHDFSIIDGEVNLTSNSRSVDAALGWNFNSIQAYFMGMMAAHLSGNTGGTVLHVCDKIHIYESHIEGVEEMLSRKPITLDTHFKINDNITSWKDWILSDCHTRELFTLNGYKGVAQGKIDFELIA